MKTILTSLLFILSLLAGSRDVRAADAWAPLQFLVGTWKGEGNAEEAAGKGTTAFTWKVGHQVLVRRDHTEYAATAQQPASTYEALMVIYRDPASGKIAADYFDSGNHVIHYQLAASDKPNTAQFLSDAPAGPTFRLSYALGAAADLVVTFEMKPPGAGTAFQTVASGVVHRQ